MQTGMPPPGKGQEPPVAYVGCCGAYCGTCRALQDACCKGCKLGYRAGLRDLANARCRIKVCCLNKGYETCADCPEFDSCETVQGFFDKNGYKYRKYREALEFIRAHGYGEFIAAATQWTGAYGSLCHSRD